MNYTLIEWQQILERTTTPGNDDYANGGHLSKAHRHNNLFGVRFIALNQSVDYLKLTSGQRSSGVFQDVFLGIGLCAGNQTTWFWQKRQL